MKPATGLLVALTFLIFADANPLQSSAKRVVCYFDETSSTYNRFECTHAINRKSRLDQTTARIPGGEIVGFGYATRTHDVKFLLALDPVNHAFLEEPQVISTKIGRSRLIESVLQVLRDMNYVGLDVRVNENDWDEISQLLSEMRPEFDKHNLLLTGLFPPVFQRDVNLLAVTKNLDFVNIKCFEETKSGTFTKLSAPLYSNRTFSVDSTIRMYLDMGVPKDKIVMGIPAFAVTHKLNNPDFNDIGSLATKKGRGNGFLTYAEITRALSRKPDDWVVRRDNTSNAPYASNYFLWVSYEDISSVKTKANYIKEKDLGGAMVWTFQANDIDPETRHISNTLSEILVGGNY